MTWSSLSPPHETWALTLEEALSLLFLYAEKEPIKYSAADGPGTRPAHSRVVARSSLGSVDVAGVSANEKAVAGQSAPAFNAVGARRASEA